MKYKYVPKVINNTKLDDETFLRYQVMYKTILEKIISSKNDFKKYDALIEKEVEITPLIDQEYNFYHKYSSLGSKYFYIRNNIHIENLTEAEINNFPNINEEFVQKTMDKVITSRGDNTFYGTPSLLTKGKSKAIIIEFAYNGHKFSVYDAKKLKDILQTIKDELFNIDFGMTIDFIINRGFDDILNPNNNVDNI